MYLTNITGDDIENITLCKCTDKENSNIEIVIPLITIIPCGMSLICLISLMVYILIKPLFNKKNTYKWGRFYIQIILVGV